MHPNLYTCSTNRSPRHIDMLSLKQLLVRRGQYIGRFLYLLLGQLPLPVIYRISYARETRFVVPRPQGRGRKDVFVLFTTGQL